VAGGLATVVGVVGALLSPGGRRLSRSRDDDAPPSGTTSTRTQRTP
jgi:hypothetical protein